MKNNKKHIILLYLIILVLVFVNIILNRNIIFDDNKIILKDMNESTQIVDKEKTIDDLNKSYTEYYNYIQTSKQEIASAITDMGVETSNKETLEMMAKNIRDIPLSILAANKTILFADMVTRWQSGGSWGNGKSIQYIAEEDSLVFAFIISSNNFDYFSASFNCDGEILYNDLNSYYFGDNTDAGMLYCYLEKGQQVTASVGSMGGGTSMYIGMIAVKASN